jgi:exodeoxyribonuclease VII large subunit
MTLSVSGLNNQIKSLLETTFLHVSVKGELSRITYHNSGHVYFTLKDEDSSISCVMFRGNVSKMKFKLQEGMAVVVHGAISVFTQRGSYQINCTSIEPDGEGALALAYEQLKQKLQAKGYFEHKKPIPKIIHKIALVTSQTGAALQDMLRVATKRWPLVKIILLDTIVQGEQSAKSIATNISLADTLGVDVIVVGRGGGSIEDLWGFNEEIVADAIFTCKTPIVSAVGHEIDFVISDFVADLRAPTPSAAIEMILPDKAEILMRLDDISNQMDRLIQRVLYNKVQNLKHLKELFVAHSFESKLSIYQKEIEIFHSRFSQKMDFLITQKSLHVKTLQENLDFNMQKFLSKKESTFKNLQELFLQNDPTKNLHANYAQIVKEGKKSTLKELHVNEEFELQSKEEIVSARVLSKKSLY